MIFSFIIQSELFWFFVLLIAFFYLVKKSRCIKIAINGIWFSVDGSMPEHAILNVMQLAQDIKESPYKKSYQIFLWTNKLKPEHLKRLRKSGIKIKSYHQISPEDALSKRAKQWVDELIHLGGEQNKIFFMLASDIFRLYLLLKEFPSRYFYDFNCYLDCNDIIIKEIPDPALFKQVTTLAFRFGFFKYTKPIFKKLVPVSDETVLFLSNDFIIARNQPVTLFDEIFAAYCHNLSNLRQQQDDFFLLINMTLVLQNTIDEELGWLIIFTTTHIVTTLMIQQNSYDQIYLLNQTKKTKSRVEGIIDAELIVDFERDREKGLIWLKREGQQINSVSVEETIAQHRDWCDVFKERYQWSQTR